MSTSPAFTLTPSTPSRRRSRFEALPALTLADITVLHHTNFDAVRFTAAGLTVILHFESKADGGVTFPKAELYRKPAKGVSWETFLRYATIVELGHLITLAAYAVHCLRAKEMAEVAARQNAEFVVWYAEQCVQAMLEGTLTLEAANAAMARARLS